MTTNDIKMLIDLVEYYPQTKGRHEIEFLKELLKEVENQSGVAVQIAVIKSPKISSE